MAIFIKQGIKDLTTKMTHMKPIDYNLRRQLTRKLKNVEQLIQIYNNQISDITGIAPLNA